jgi:hypothetical protein
MHTILIAIHKYSLLWISTTEWQYAHSSGSHLSSSLNSLTGNSASLLYFYVAY